MWKHISSPYILGFGGAFYHNDVPAIITPWMFHGNIAEYLEVHPNTDRLRLVSLSVPARPGVRSFRAPSLRSFLAWWKDSDISTIMTWHMGTSKR